MNGGDNSDMQQDKRNVGLIVIHTHTNQHESSNERGEWKTKAHCLDNMTESLLLNTTHLSLRLKLYT